MSWTYTNSPATVPRDEVRFLTGDVLSTDQLVSDEEIAYALGITPNARMAAASIARAIASRFSRQADKQVGDLQISYSQRAAAYLKLAEELKTDAVLVSAAVYCGGISKTDKLTDETNSDRVKPSFKRGAFDDHLLSPDMSPLPDSEDR
jgi:hypothetical protein